MVASVRLPADELPVSGSVVANGVGPGTGLGD